MCAYRRRTQGRTIKIHLSGFLYHHVCPDLILSGSRRRNMANEHHKTIKQLKRI